MVFQKFHFGYITRLIIRTRIQIFTMYAAICMIPFILILNNYIEYTRIMYNAHIYHTVTFLQIIYVL